MKTVTIQIPDIIDHLAQEKVEAFKREGVNITYEEILTHGFMVALAQSSLPQIIQDPECSEMIEYIMQRHDGI